MSILKVQVPTKGRKGLYVTIGVWQKNKDWIALAFPGKKVQAPVNNKPGTSRYQPHLYKILRGLLEDYGRWERDGEMTGTHVRRTKRFDELTPVQRRAVKARTVRLLKQYEDADERLKKAGR